MLDQGILDQLMNNHSGSDLGDQIQMAKFRQSQGQSPSPIAPQPVMRGDGMPAKNPGIQTASADTSPAGGMDDYVSQMLASEQQAPGMDMKPTRKPDPTKSLSGRNVMQAQGKVPLSQHIQSQMDPKQGALRQGIDPMLAAILQRLQQKPVGPQAQQRPSMGISP